MNRQRLGSAVATTVAILTAVALWHPHAAADDDPSISAIQYNREIVRIFARKCVACHAKNTLSLPLDSYRAVRPWGRGIREELLERRMPPWPAATGVRPFANDPSLTVRELNIVTAWTDGGLPRGDAQDLPRPAPRAEWPAGLPDEVIQVPAQSIAADGTPQVRRVNLPNASSEERWLSGFDLVPGAAQALRSAFLFVTLPGGGRQWVGGWTPWYAMAGAPEGTAHPIPANASLSLELHYVSWSEEPNSALTDASRLGLYLRPQRPATAVGQIVVSASPADRASGQTASVTLRGSEILADDLVVWALRPTLEAGGRDIAGAIEVTAVRPDGGIEPLLWIRENTIEWQFPYVLAEPLRLPAGARVRLTARPVAPSSPAAPPTARVVILSHTALPPANESARGPKRPTQP
jgi:hypothetical protein